MEAVTFSVEVYHQHHVRCAITWHRIFLDRPTIWKMATVNDNYYGSKKIDPIFYFTYFCKEFRVRSVFIFVLFKLSLAFFVSFFAFQQNGIFFYFYVISSHLFSIFLILIPIFIFCCVSFFLFLFYELWNYRWFDRWILSFVL